MGTLIIGGLLVIALLAIVGSIFAARGGTPNNARRTAAATATPKEATLSNEARVEAPATEPPTPQPQESIGQLLPPGVESAHNGQTHDEQIVPTLPLTDGLPSYNADGQVHELTAQLQALHEEAQHLSQRLSILTEMAEHIEGRQSARSEDGA